MVVVVGMATDSAAAIAAATVTTNIEAVDCRIVAMDAMRIAMALDGACQNRNCLEYTDGIPMASNQRNRFDRPNHACCQLG